MLPTAVDLMALSLNENPFRPLLRRSGPRHRVDRRGQPLSRVHAETLRHLIADHIGLPDEQVIRSGATGVMLQVLHAITDLQQSHRDRT